MKNQLLSLFFLFIAMNTFAQAKFENGYFTDSENNKTECLIKNPDWRGIPKQIEYKISEASAVMVLNFDQMNSFQIYNTPHYYQKHVSLIDRKRDKKDFEPTKQTAVFKVLVEGNASLFTNSDGIFFFQKQNGPINQLVYKSYIEEKFVKENNLYRNQLFDSLKCANNAASVRKIKYREDALVGFFKAYNTCQQSDFKTFEKNNTKTQFNFNIIGGAHLSSLDFSSYVNYFSSPGGGASGTKHYVLKSDGILNFSLGFEAEMLLPFRKNNWSLYFAPSYRNIKQDYFEELLKPTETSYRNLSVTAKYSFLDLPIGVRNYIYLNDKNKFFLDAALTITYTLDAKETQKIETSYNTPSILEADRKGIFESALRFGAGVKHSEKYALSLYYSTKKSVSQAKIGDISVVASYKLF